MTPTSFAAPVAPRTSKSLKNGLWKRRKFATK